MCFLYPVSFEAIEDEAIYFGGKLVVKITKEECICLLWSKAAEIDRCPMKSDFTEHDVSVIKSYFGPWPRALEAVGLKTVNSVSRKEKNKIKRELTRQRVKIYKCNKLEHENDIII